MFRRMKRIFSVLVVIPLLLVTLAPITSATPPEGPVTIVTAIDFSSFPFGGTFEVTEGDGILGCPSGMFTDLPRGFGVIQKIFSCTGGTGTFTFLFVPGPSPGPGDANGHWEAWKATGAFVGLRGEGDFSLVITGRTSGVETLTGVIHFEP
jgi:hypothetical protein